MTATSKSKVSNGTRLLAGVDGRSATFRRFRDLVADLMAEQDRDLSISEIGLIRSAAALLVRSEELQAAAVRNEDLDGDELIRLTSEARRLLHCLRKSALPEPEPMSIEEHLATYGAVKPRQAREPASQTRRAGAAGPGEGLRATMRRPDPWMPPASSAETRIAA